MSVRGKASAGLLAAGAVAAAGCGGSSTGAQTVNPVKVEKFLITTFHHEFPEDSYKITCPKGVKVVAGKTFYCDNTGNTSAGSQDVCVGLRFLNSAGKATIDNSNAPNPPCFKGPGGPSESIG
jgi:hypothetical protein